MSTKCLAWGTEQRTGSATRKLILMLLCDLADEQHTCYPGRAYLAQRAELSERAVSSAVTQLVADGFVRVLRRARRRGGRTSNRYLIMIYGTSTPLPEIDDWVSEFAIDDDETAGQSNREPDAHMPDADHETAGDSNGEPAAHMPAPTNSDLRARSYGNDVPFSNKEEIYPLGVNKDHSPPPPTFTPPASESSSAAVIAARTVLRTATADVKAERLPTDAERGRLLDRVVELIAAGWDGEQLAARLRGMGPLTTVASVYAVLVTRLRQVGDPPAVVTSAAPLARWCGDPGCDRTTRRQVDAEGRPRFAVGPGRNLALWCPTCSGR